MAGWAIARAPAAGGRDRAGPTAFGGGWEPTPRGAQPRRRPWSAV